MEFVASEFELSLDDPFQTVEDSDPIPPAEAVSSAAIAEAQEQARIVAPVVDAELIVAQYDTAAYGNRFEGLSDTSGDITFAFDAPGTDLTLYVTGFDIDTRTEVEILMNDVLIGHLKRSPNDDYRDTILDISMEYLQEGENFLTFNQTITPAAKWGVTDIVIMGEGIQDSGLPIDPEFSEDGYAAWQSDDYFYFGRMDLDSGAMIEILHEVDIKPTNIKRTHQGPELIETSEHGLGAIGVSDAGLVHYTATEAYLLEGTEGLKIGYVPKGVTPGLRFMAHDYDKNLYLYDNGVVTPFDLGGGIVTSWLNPSEFVVSFRAIDVPLISVYNLDTGEMTDIAENAYGSPAHQAAFTDSEGVQWAALTGGRYHDLWRNDGDGWEEYRRISSPLDTGEYFYSPEFFEWNGQMFIAGNVALGPGEGVAAPVLYNVTADTWSQIGPTISMIDPEIFLMNGNRMAYYFADIEDPANFIEYFLTVSYEDVLAGQVPATTSIDLSGASALRSESDAFVFGASEEPSETNMLAETTALERWQTHVVRFDNGLFAAAGAELGGLTPTDGTVSLDLTLSAFATVPDLAEPLARRWWQGRFDL